MQRIESVASNLYKNTKKLLARSGRRKSGTFIIEGERIVKDAANGRAKLKYIFVNDSYLANNSAEFEGITVYSLPDKLFEGVTDTVNTQGILAVAEYTACDISGIDYVSGRYLYLDSVSDPGNMGTIIRTADAFGVKGIILSDGCVDVYNPKVLRSTMSGIFNVPIYFDDGKVLDIFKENGFKIAGTFLDADYLSNEFEYTDKCVIIMGNEANGISKETEDKCTHRITIPMTGGAESLNVSVACAVVLYEAFTEGRK